MDQSVVRPRPDCAPMSVADAVSRRTSVRAFKPDPVPVATVRDILDTARRAPSGGNLQPWLVHVLAGASLKALTDLIGAKMQAGEIAEESQYQVYPSNLWEPYRGRRRETGRERYAALGVMEKSEEGRLELLRRNYRFFDAPVGLFFCLDRRVGSPQWADVGMYMQSVMLLALSHGLDTCPQEVWSNWGSTVAGFLGLPDGVMVFCGMALGYRDETDPLCAVPTQRAPLNAFAVFHGFDHTE